MPDQLPPQDSQQTVDHSNARISPAQPSPDQSQSTLERDRTQQVFRRGYRALVEQLGSKVADTLRGWIRKEDQLVSEVCKHAKGEPSRLSDQEYEAAVQAGRVGRVLAAAEHVQPIQVPQAFGDQRKDIDLLATRFHSFGLGKAITVDNLRQISPAQMRPLVDNARKLGLLDDGLGWATKTIAAKCIAHDIVHAVEKNRSLDRGAVR
jgi:hypothetical protein